MRFIEPTNLKTPRTYFTGFDRSTYSYVEWTTEQVEEMKCNLERKVKLLSLIKGMLILPAHDLFESELCKEFIMENSIVLEEDIILPALISKYKDFSDFLSTKREESKENYLYKRNDTNEINTLLNNSLVVRWDEDLSNKWFKHRLSHDLMDERSVLRSNLNKVPLSLITEVKSRINEIESSSRSDTRIEIYYIGRDSGNKTLRNRLSDYTDFIYYLSGAIAVNSEGVLPQENLIDFSITDLTREKTKLSEYEIFYRIFVSIIMEKTQRCFPVELLDLLTFEDIVELRKILLHRGFVDKYNRLLTKTKQRVEIQDTEQLVLNLDELNQFENELHLTFRETIAAEVRQKNMIELKRKERKVLTNIGSLLTFYGTVESVSQLTVNVLSLLGYDKQIHQTEARIKQKLTSAEYLINKKSIDNKPLLLQFLSEISKKQSSKIVGI